MIPGMHIDPSVVGKFVDLREICALTGAILAVIKGCPFGVYNQPLLALLTDDLLKQWNSSHDVC